MSLIDPTLHVMAREQLSDPKLVDFAIKVITSKGSSTLSSAITTKYVRTLLERGLGPQDELISALLKFCDYSS